MSTETEVKVKISDPALFCEQLARLGARPLTERHFEDNQLVDFPDGRLRENGCLLRVRLAGNQASVTFKGAPRPEGIFKVREELETEIGDEAVALQILQRLGLSVCFRYQKYRREFEVANIQVAVDETPVGNYVEFEGTEEDILSLAAQMRISASQFLRASYASLYFDYCREKGMAPGFMIF